MTSSAHEILHCCTCAKHFHAVCLQPPLNFEIVSQRGPWECLECKSCSICKRNNEEEKIIICDMCDRAIHIDCLTPPLGQVPQQSWFCSECIMCYGCHKAQPVIKLSADGYWIT